MPPDLRYCRRCGRHRATTTGAVGDWGQWNRQWLVTTATATTTISSVNLWQQWNMNAAATPIALAGWQIRTVAADGELADGGQHAQAVGETIEELQKKQEAADRLARELLEEHLDRAQRRELRARHRFHVVGADDKTYRLTRGWAHNAFLIEDGILAEEYCIHPRITIPVDDHLLAQKLLLETDPAAFRRIANVTPMRHLRRAA